MTQSLVSLGLGSFGSIAQLVLVGLSPGTSEPIDWIDFAAIGRAPAAAVSLAIAGQGATGCVAAASVCLAVAGIEATGFGEDDQGYGRPEA